MAMTIRMIAPMGTLLRPDLPLTFILTDLSASEEVRGPVGEVESMIAVLWDWFRGPVAAFAACPRPPVRELRASVSRSLGLRPMVKTPVSREEVVGVEEEALVAEASASACLRRVTH